MMENYKAQHKELRILMLCKIIYRSVELPLTSYPFTLSLLHVVATRSNNTKFIQPTTSRFMQSHEASFFTQSLNGTCRQIT